jgi:hypothetical protein
MAKKKRKAAGVHLGQLKLALGVLATIWKEMTVEDLPGLDPLAANATVKAMHDSGASVLDIMDGVLELPDDAGPQEIIEMIQRLEMEATASLMGKTPEEFSKWLAGGSLADNLFGGITPPQDEK